MMFYHVLSEAILYQGKPLDLSNTVINSQYFEKACLPGFGVTESTQLDDDNTLTAEC